VQPLRRAGMTRPADVGPPAVGAESATAAGVAAAPVITVPKGGGAIRAIGEKFAANPATGTGSLAVPIPVSPGRSGFTPTLGIRYDSGHGNGPCGLGWQLDVPAVTRKTDRGVPRYRDHEPAAGEPLDNAQGVPVHDTFLLPGGEDLVPVLEHHAGGWRKHVAHRAVVGRTYEVRRYRPRVDEAFARTERWTDGLTGETHWRTISRDGVTAVYGRTAESRIADPADPRRVFSWLLCETYDGRGNATRYSYRAEDDAGVDLDAPHERHRTPWARSANRYLKRVRYGNRTPLRPMDELPDLGSADWLFELVLDYGEHDEDWPTEREDRPWTCRPDPFSSYRSGFEIRTYRRCRRFVMVHHFADEHGPDGPVLALELDYASSGTAAGLSMLTTITHRGYRDDPDGPVVRSLPPLELEYSRARIDDRIRTPDAASKENLPAGLLAPTYRWVDLDGEALSGVLTEQAGTWFYRDNLGGGRLGPQRLVPDHPNPAALTRGDQELIDLDGDGRLDLFELTAAHASVSERTDDEGWTTWRPLPAHPVVDLRDPRVRLVDLNGDGRVDLLVLDDEVLTWFPSRGEQGFGPGSRCPAPHQDGHRPGLLFADGTESLHLADVSGDGLADLVRVRNGEVCYWPSLGYARFGAQVTMDSAPWLDEPDQFDPRRIRLADLDGSGPIDLIYLHRDGVRLYANRSGNSWAPAEALPVRFPRIDSAIQVVAVDLLGTGTSCLVWSSPLPADAGAPLRYVDLLHDGKPHLLTGVRNNLGAQTTVRYAPSTRFYLADKARGRPWATRAPFPVHVVEHVETRDLITHNVFTTRYAYHEIFYDTVEREFGGFGLVEQWDTEDIGILSSAGSTPADPASMNLDPATHLPPVLTRSWFHTGARTRAAHLAHPYPGRYHRPGAEVDLLTADPPVLFRTGGRGTACTLLPDERRQAARALRGRLLRQEVYALDGTEAQDRPYAVTTHLHAVELRQPGAGLDPGDEAWRPAVFVTFRTHTREEHHERLLREIDGRRVPDPRVHDDVVLEVDEYLDVLRSAAVAHARRHPDPDAALTDRDRAEQARARCLLTEHRFTNAIDAPDAYRTPLPAESVTSELVGLDLDPGTTDARALRALFAGPMAELPPGDWAAGPEGPARRLLEHERSFFRRDDLCEDLPLGALEPLALPAETFRLAFTPDLVEGVYGERVDDRALAAAGYVAADGGWWAPAGRVHFTPDGTLSDPASFAAAHFYQPQRFEDPFGAVTTVEHDRYDLLVLATRDAVGNVVSVGERDGDCIVTNGLDYRVLQPRLVCDANGNVTEVGYDALGRITATAVRGKPGSATGDGLGGLALDPDPDVLAAFFAEPVDVSGRPSPVTRGLLGAATSRLLYDPDAFRRSSPARQADAPATVTLARDLHVADAAAPQVQQAFAYSDGLARVSQHKTLAEPDEDGHPRWAGTGWTVFDNKGLPVRRYEAFFTDTHRFEFARTAGVSTVVFYDPLGRPVATLHPNGSYEKRTIDPWRLVVWDRNDTVALDPATDADVAPHAGRYLAGLAAAGTPWRTWYRRRAGGELGADERRAAEQTLLHAGTPARTWSDALGRAFLTVLHNRTPDPSRRRPRDHLHHTHLELDVQGRTREIRDPLGRLVTRLDYDLRGTLVARASADSGPGATLPDVLGAPARSWNARGYRFRTEYDPLHRPFRSWVAGPDITGERQHQRTEYGEGVPDAADRNLRTQVYRRYDGAGVVTHVEYDVQGNLARASRRLAADVLEEPDWSRAVPLDDERLDGSTSHDALDRPRTVTTPDGSTVTAAYSVAGLLRELDVDLAAARDVPTETTPVVRAISYNARGQRAREDHGNGTRTHYEYDPETFRLRRICTRRGAERVQDLRQVYDPEGNVTAVRDSAQHRLFFRNRVVDPGGTYVYDALYRLIAATGREHLGQLATGRRQSARPTAHDVGPAPLHPHDGPAMGRYVERYGYDEVGNLTQVRHVGSYPGEPGWTRDYRYAEPSLLEPDRTANRLSTTGSGSSDAAPEPFEHDEQGNITSMPGLKVLRWDPEDRLHIAARERARSDPGEPGADAVVAAYDATGTRTRKAVSRRRSDGPVRIARERVYLGPFERYREYDPTGAVVVERTTLHVSDDERRVALVETRTEGSDEGPARLLRYQLSDHLGSSVVELDQQARVISYEEYHPYGSTAYQASTTETPKRYRYTGRERDAETGLQYHGQRYYAPWLGRWTSPDPAGPTDALSPYVYVAGNPMRLVDPGGRQGNPPPQLFGNAIYGVKVAGRALFGQNVQIDHPIQVAARVAQRTPPGGPALYSRAASKTAGELGVLLETGKGKFHTILGGFQKQITAAVKSGTLASESELVAATQAAYAQTAQITGTTVNQLARDTAILSNQATVHRTLAETVAELQAYGSSAAPSAGSSSAGAATALAEETSFAQIGQELGFAQKSATPAAGAAVSAAEATPAVEAAVNTGAALGSKAGRLASIANGAGRVLKAAAPVLRVVGKVAGPLTLGIGIYQAATAGTPAEKADAAINVTSGALALSSNPVTGIAAGSIVAGGFVGGKVGGLVTEATGSRTAGVGAGTLAGAATGAAIGAAVGSIVPGLGTAVGAGVGAAAGAIGGFVKSYWSEEVPLFAGIAMK
jgi:RHS repeat-associated protein